MKYSEQFKDAIAFCKSNNLFLGYGNPNGKILMIGKEHYFNHGHEENTIEFYEEIIDKRREENQKNITSWEDNVQNNFEPKWDSNQKYYCDTANAFTAWWNQRNVQNRKLKNDEWNGGTSNTYLHYQKLYQKVFLNGNKQERINFQKEFFITELNDFPSKKSYNHSRMNELRNGSIHKRKELFGKPFFKSFPVVVIATGHYPRNYGFDIERIFEVEWTKETIPVRNSWYNAHYSSDNKRMLIHTRQLSTSVSNDLINALSNEINNFLKQEISKSKLY